MRYLKFSIVNLLLALALPLHAVESPYYRVPIEADAGFLGMVIQEETSKVVAFCRDDKGPKCQTNRISKLLVSFEWRECLNHGGPQVAGQFCTFGTLKGKRMRVAVDRDPEHVRAIYRHELCHRLKYKSEDEANRCERESNAD